MEFQIWQKTPAFSLTRVITIICLVILLIIYTLYFKSFNLYLLSFRPGFSIPGPIWILISKFFSYSLNILINFCILYAITNRLHYSLTMVIVAFIILFTGALLLFFEKLTGMIIPLPLITLFVKINKSFILLVLFIAGNMVKPETGNKK